MDYIIIDENNKPLVFEDGDIIVYGSKEEAMDDFSDNSDSAIVSIDYDTYNGKETATLYLDGNVIGWFSYDIRYDDDETEFQSKLKKVIGDCF